MLWVLVGDEARPGELVVPKDLCPGGMAAGVVLRYGRRQARVRLRVVESETEGRSVRPGVRTVHVGPDLLERLLIRTEPQYQFRVGPGTVEIGPVIGLLLGERAGRMAQGFPAAGDGSVADAYSRSGGLYCAFSAGRVSRDGSSAVGMFFDPASGCWTRDRIPVPPVIYRRSFLQRQALIDGLRSLPGVQLFNSRRFDKWQLYMVFRDDGVLAGHLPETEPAVDGEGVRAMCARLGGVVLKPRNLSRGRGVLFLESQEDDYILTFHYPSGEPVRQAMTAADVDSAISEHLAGCGFLCQRRLHLARVDGRPFDIRMVMHRFTDGGWGCSGIECRVAGKGRLLTNISAGGEALWLDECLRRASVRPPDGPAFERELTALALRVCSVLDSTGEHFAELGLDFALDSTGRFWLLESNVLPGFHGFKALDPDVYRAILRAPLAYGCSLAGFAMPADDRAAPEAGPVTDCESVAAYAIRAPYLMLSPHQAAGEDAAPEPKQAPGS